MKRLCTLWALLWLLAVPGQAQVPVSLAPSVHPQFVDGTGKVLSGGFIYTYQAGTTIRQDTYTDSTGTIINAWPIPLDATGSPSNLSTQTGIWLSNNSFKFCGYNSALVLQWCTDNVSAYQILNNIQNITFGSVTSDPTGAAGELGYRSDLACLREYTTFWDCLVTLTGIQSLTNKTLVNPVISSSTGAVLNSPNINGTIVTGPPATYLVMTNDLATGTVLNKLAKINPAGLAGFAILPLITDTGGMTGVVVAGAGITGNATIQQSGSASCVFDNAVTSGDYVQISPTIAGDCHDSGVAYPSSNQVLGRVLATNVAAGTYLIDLFGPEIKAGNQGAAIGCTNFTPATITNNNTVQTLLSCPIPANTLGQGNMLQVDITGIESTASAGTISIFANLGGGTACSTTSVPAGVGNNQPWNFVGKFSVLTAGAGGTGNWSCQYFSSSAGGGLAGPNGVVGAPTIAVNTTISNTLLIQVQMSVANAGNSVTGQLLKAVIF